MGILHLNAFEIVFVEYCHLNMKILQWWVTVTYTEIINDNMDTHKLIHQQIKLNWIW